MRNNKARQKAIYTKTVNSFFCCAIVPTFAWIVEFQLEFDKYIHL